jgi:hypothetical protein
MQTNNWLSERIGKFTSSESEPLLAPKGIGKGGMTYISRKVAEMLRGEVVKPIVSNYAIEWGNQNEPIAAVRYFANNSGVYYGKENPKFFPYGDHAGGSPDGLSGDDGIIEIKCPDSDTHVKYMLFDGSDDEHEHYVQIQMNLLVTDRQWCDFISFDPRIIREELQLHIQRINRDEKFIELIKSRLKEATEIKVKMLERIINKK